MKRILTLLFFLIQLSVLAQTTVEFEKTYTPSCGSMVGYSVQQTYDGGYIAVGGLQGIYVVRTNAIGDTVWTRCIGFGTGTDGQYIKQTRDSGFIVVGSTNAIGAGDYDIYLLRLNSFGDTIWTRTYGTVNREMGTCVEITFDDNFIITGDSSNVNGSGSDLILMKVDSAGNRLWSNRYDVAGNDIGYNVRQTSDTGFIVAGQCDSNLSDILWIFRAS